MNEIGMSLTQILDALVEIEADLARLTARRAEILASATAVRLAESRPDQQGLAMRSLTAEIGCATRLSESTVIRHLNDAHTLTSSLPGTLSALSSGTISYRHAQVMVAAATPIPFDSRGEFEEALLPVACTTTAARFERIARREREHLHPDSIETRTRAATAERHVTVTPDVDGMAWLTAYLPAVLATAIDNRLTTIARAAKTADEPRTIPQLRTDALTSLLTHPTTSRPAGTSSTSPTDAADTTPGAGTATLTGTAPEYSTATATAGNTGATASRTGAAVADLSMSAGTTTATSAISPWATDGAADEAPHQFVPIPDAFLAIAPTVILTVPALSLLGHDDGPAELHGAGPIDLATARHLAARAPSFIRILTHPDTGETLSVGRTRYRPPPDLRLALLLEDQTCRFPTCNQRAETCELDHTHDWAHGGTTDPANLHHLCAKHHHLKHDTTGWNVTAHPGRHLEWTTPTGRKYTTEPGRPSEPRRRRVPVFEERSDHTNGADVRPP